MPPESKRAALLLAPETPYPLAGGGALRTASLLHHLARSYDVDLLVFRQPGAPDPARHLPAGLVRRVFVIDLARNGRSLAARALRNAVRVTRAVPPLVDRFSGFARQIEDMLAGRRYDIGIVEHFWCAPYHDQLAKVCSRTILDLHNIESLLHQRCAQVEGNATAFAHQVFRRASLDLERTWLPRFSQLLAVSESDAELAAALAPGARITIYPNAIPLAPLPPQSDEEAIVFSGNMEYHPNQSAVRFFRREVWPSLREQWPRLTWRLVGKNPEAVRQFTSGDPRIAVQGQVEDAVAELARARVAVVPLLAGSGTRLKILEAWAAGLPVVSTTLGAEGLTACDGEHLLLADGAARFAGAVSRLLACSDLRRKLGAAGRLLLENEFTWEKAWKKLDF
ncbi:Glycosyl transferase, group 1 [Candidatus Sulfopaludibacter sp. SbA4]|nr:Glycosyl transferase, group 1 [Candidatus Sulfopaludibacter sp. SbA4]